MKKLLALTLSFVMAASLLAACGTDEESSSTPGSSSVTDSVVDDSSSVADSTDSTDDAVEDSSEEPTDDSSEDATDAITAQSVVDYALTVGQWGMGTDAHFLDSEMVEDKNAYLMEFYQIDATKFKDLAMAISMITAQYDSILVIEADGNIDEAIATVEAYKELKKGSAWYPEEQEVFENSITGSVGNFAYFISHSSALEEVEAAVIEYLS